MMTLIPAMAYEGGIDTIVFTWFGLCCLYLCFVLYYEKRKKTLSFLSLAEVLYSTKEASKYEEHS